MPHEYSSYRKLGAGPTEQITIYIASAGGLLPGYQGGSGRFFFGGRGRRGGDTIILMNVVYRFVNNSSLVRKMKPHYPQPLIGTRIPLEPSEK